MALTLRELLDKQRAEREQQESVKAPSVPLAHGDLKEQVQPYVAGKAEPIPPKANGLLSRLSKTTETPVASADTPREKPTPVTPTTVQAPLQVSPPVPVPSPAIPQGVFTEDETATLRKNLAFLVANLDEKEMIGQILRTTVRQIQEHPELNAVMVDSDFDIIVAAARKSVKYVARRKEEKAETRGKKKAGADELNTWLKDQGIEL